MAGIESSRQPISGGEVQWDVYPSVQLFVRRVAARAGSFALTDKEAPFVAEMCRKLDGLPLAIELAAGQVAALGLKNTFARLVFRMELLRLSHRTAVLRHRTPKRRHWIGATICCLTGRGLFFDALLLSSAISPLKVRSMSQANSKLKERRRWLCQRPKGARPIPAHRETFSRRQSGALGGVARTRAR
jgi:hypothetical protein